MTPPVFFAVAALGLTVPLMAQSPVHLMPGETRGTFACLTISDEVESTDAVRSSFIEVGPCGLGAEDAIRADRNVLVFSDLNPLAPGEHFCPVRMGVIEGLEAVPLESEEPVESVPADPPAPVPDGVVTVSRSTPTLSAATPVPEPSSAFLAAIAATGLMRRRRF